METSRKIKDKFDIYLLYQAITSDGFNQDLFFSLINQSTPHIIEFEICLINSLCHAHNRKNYKNFPKDPSLVYEIPNQTARAFLDFFPWATRSFLTSLKKECDFIRVKKEVEASLKVKSDFSFLNKEEFLYYLSEQENLYNFDSHFLESFIFSFHLNANCYVITNPRTESGVCLGVIQCKEAEKLLKDQILVRGLGRSEDKKPIFISLYLI